MTLVAAVAELLAEGISTTQHPTNSYISPTDGISRTGIERDLAGLEFEFLYAPDTEAPEEMYIWIPQLKALTWAENTNHGRTTFRRCAAPDPRRPKLRPLPRRDAGTVVRRRRGQLRTAHLAGLGQHERHRVHRVAARHVQVHPRPGHAAGDKGTPRSRRPR